MPDSFPRRRTRYSGVLANNGQQPSAERSPRWGDLPSRRGIVVVASGAVIGTVITIIAGGSPGFALGFFVVVATLAAAFAVGPRAVYRIIPAPALAYLAGAVIAGLIHDGATNTSRTELAINAAQWIAHGFVAMTTATVLVILVGAARWGRLWRRYGTSPNSAIGRRQAGPRPPASGGSRRRSNPPSGLGR